LKDFFEDYDTFVLKLEPTMTEYEKSCEYIKAQYVAAFNGRRLYPFVTCAIDTANCDRVFSAVRDTVVSGALSGAGL